MGRPGAYVGGTSPNVLIAATLNDTIYAYNADATGAGGSVLWKYSQDVPHAGPPLYLNCRSGKPVVPSGGGPAGALPYFGIVSTPVIDTTWTDPVLYTVSACTGTDGPEFYLNAIDVASGANLLSASTLGGAGGMQIADPSGVFNAAYQVQRPALLLTHETVHGQLVTYVYIAFGTLVDEIDPNRAYYGWVFGYTISYGTGSLPVTATLISGSPFNDTPSGTTASVFPAVSSAAPGTGASGSGPALNPSCSVQNTNCYDGDNWVDVGGHGGGIWMSAKGPSSDSTGNVYVASGNGPFDCINPSSSSCLTSAGSTIKNYGESVMEIPVGGATPADFFTPNALHYANDTTPGSQFQALNRYDLDFGTPGVVLFTTTLNSGTQTWAVTADKTGYAYVMPTPGSGSTVSLGQYQPSDSGLTSGNYTTQAPFAASRAVGNFGSTLVCPEKGSGIYMTGTNCDQIMQLASWNDMLFAWPWHETAMTFQGSGTYNPTTLTYNYQFGSRIGACSPGGTDAFSCANFPSANFPGGIWRLRRTGRPMRRFGQLSLTTVVR